MRVPGSRPAGQLTLAFVAGTFLAACGGSDGEPAPAAAKQATASGKARVVASARSRFQPASRVRLTVRRPATAQLIARFSASNVTVKRFGATLYAKAPDGPVQKLCSIRPTTRSVVVAADSSTQRVVAGCGRRTARAAVRLVPETKVTSARGHLASVRTRRHTPRVFAADSIWNAKLKPSAPLDSRSDEYAADIRRQVQATTAFVNTTQFSIPVYTVGPNQPTVRVQPDPETAGVRELQEAWAEVPLPDEAKPSGGSDRNIVVYQPSTDTLWEFYLARREADGWHARWGGRMNGVSGNPGHFTGRERLFGASATSLSVLGGLIRIPELQQGRIDHALALALPQTRAGVFSLPAQRTDGRINSESAIPQGTRFRLDPNFDVDSAPMNPTVKAMAKAAQDYGIVIRDTSGAVSFYAEDPARLGNDPYLGKTGLFGTDDIGGALNQQFPWNHLQALKTDLR